MGIIKQKNKQLAISRQIRDFAQDAYDYIWSQQEFITPGVAEKFAEAYSLRISSETEMKDSYFTEHIGRAVRITQLLLRDYFGRLFEFTFEEKSTFLKEVKLMWLHWLENRNNIFVKVIDTLAVVAEIFLFCDSHEVIDLELFEITALFIEWFEENLAPDFFRSGGWKQLNEQSLIRYGGLFIKFQELLKIYKRYSDFIYTCQIVDCLKSSLIRFPVPESVLRNKSIFIDKNKHRKTVYVRLATEVLEKLKFIEAGSEITGEHLEFQREVVSLAQIKNKPIFSKLDTKEELITKDNSSFRLKLHIEEVEKDITDIGRNRQFSSEFNTDTKHSNLEIPKDFTTSIANNYNEDLYANNIQQSSVSSKSSLQSEENLSIKPVLPKEQNGLNRELSSETLRCPNQDMANARSKKQLYFSRHSEEHAEAKKNPNFISDKITLNTCFINSNENFISQNSPNKQFPLSAVSHSCITLPAPESSTILEQMPTAEDKLSAQQDLQSTKPIEETPINKDDFLTLIKTLDFNESVTYNEFLKLLQENITSKDCEVDGPKDQNKFYLMSEKFYHSFEKLFEA